MDVVALQNFIIAKPERIEIVLEKLGFTNIRDRGRYYQFPNKQGDNMSACSILKETLHYENYSHGQRGNIFTLVMDDKHCDFYMALCTVANYVGFKNTQSLKVTLPFGGFYKFLDRSADDLYDLSEYSTELLPEKDSLSEKFLRDNIPLIVQERWGVRYSHQDDAILIPIYQHSKLVGCKARSNDPYCPKENRWWAYLPYAKTQVVYGLEENYKAIQKINKLVVFESEKSVMQADGYGLKCTTAIGGHSISPAQAKQLKATLVDEIIVAFDEGISEEETRYEAQKLCADNMLLSTKVGYIYDAENDVLRKGYKDSPSDLGREQLQTLLKRKVRWLNG